MQILKYSAIGLYHRYLYVLCIYLWPILAGNYHLIRLSATVVSVSVRFCNSHRNSKNAIEMKVFVPDVFRANWTRRVLYFDFFSPVTTLTVGHINYVEPPNSLYNQTAGYECQSIAPQVKDENLGMLYLLYRMNALIIRVDNNFLTY
jgi:hypothetical protein